MNNHLAISVCYDPSSKEFSLFVGRTYIPIPENKAREIRNQYPDTVCRLIIDDMVTEESDIIRDLIW